MSDATQGEARRALGLARLGAPLREPLGEELRRGLALGYLAMLPLFLMYELALGAGEVGVRSTSELVFSLPLSLLGRAADPARWVLLAVAGVWALVHCLRRDLALGPRLARIVAEGALGALLLGPILIVGMHLLEDRLPPFGLRGAPEQAPELHVGAFVCGAAAYEELLFRVGLYSLLYVVTRRVAEFLGLGRVVSPAAAEVVGLLVSSCLFAAWHLASFVSWLGTGGEPFDLAVFTWRTLAGILLGLVFRLRGPGVAAWTHGLFNLALLLGAGPEVFL